jgi:oxygen-dependent protoporphyrinogen oxidase
VEVPQGFYLIAPTDALAFLKSSLVSPLGKLRMLAEPWVPARSSDDDESVASFVRRRFGPEALEKIGQPMLAGIYTGDPETLSLSATMPRFRNLEKKHGSVLKGLLGEARQKRSMRQARGARTTLFLSFKEGMETLTRSLSERLPAGSLRLGTAVRTVLRDPATGKWVLGTSNGESVETDILCSALPARASSHLLSKTDPVLSEKLSRIRYESVATLNLAFRRTDFASLPAAFGFVVARKEKRNLLACTFASLKFARRAPQDSVLLRAFVGGAFGKATFGMADEPLEAAVLKDLSELLGLKSKPLFRVLQRYPDSMVQYAPGHLGLVREIEKSLEETTNLFLLGASYRGVGIPDCIEDAEVQAEKIFNYLTSSRASESRH